MESSEASPSQSRATSGRPSTTEESVPPPPPSRATSGRPSDASPRHSAAIVQKDSSAKNIGDHSTSSTNANSSSGSSLFQCCMGEFLGTFLLVLFGCASCIKNGITVTRLTPPTPHSAGMETPASLQLQISLAFGIAVATIAQAIGHVSGCHLNPAVTFGLMVTGGIDIFKGLSYVCNQCLGAISASLVLIIMTRSELTPPSEPDFCQCCSVIPYRQNSIVAALVTEFAIVFMLVLTVCGVCDSRRSDVKGSAPLAIGLAVFLGHIIGIRFSGASMNPARSFGPMIVGTVVHPNDRRLWNVWAVSWVYWVGPIAGGMTAGKVYNALFKA